MRVVIQRVSEASVMVDDNVTGRIGCGMLILLGIEECDAEEDVDWLCRKIAGLRIFADAGGVMNVPITEMNGDALVVSQFTLHASTKKGNRPSYIHAARPERAIPLYGQFCALLGSLIGKPVQTGIFGAMMHVSLINDGPVTILIDSRNRE